MEKISKNYKIRKSRIFTKEQDLANQIYDYFNKELKFGFIMNKIKTKGYQFIYEIWNEVKQSNPKKAISLFMWKIGNTKINFKDEIKPVN